MRVKAVKSFVDKVGDTKYRVEQDQEFELPEGVNWLDVGFVVPARDIELKTATIAPKEKAVTRSRASKAVDKVMGRGKGKSK